MNTKRIILGGLAAGLIITVGEAILNVLVLGIAQADTHRSPAGGMPIGVFALQCVMLGIGCVLLYAAMRPRLGAGPKSAVTAGLLVFLIGATFPPLALVMPAFSPSRAALVAMIWNAVEIPLATLVGAWIYREQMATWPAGSDQRATVTTTR